MGEHLERVRPLVVQEARYAPKHAEGLQRPGGDDSATVAGLPSKLANDFSNLSPKRISYVTGGLITAVIGILMMPWRLYSDAAAYIFTWLIGYSSLMGALGGILIADYWVVRRQQLAVRDLFLQSGRYSYVNGVNWRAIAALLIAVLPVVPGFIHAATTPGGQVADPTILDRLYTYAWFVTFILSFTAYLVLMRTRPVEAADRAPSFGQPITES